MDDIYCAINEVNNKELCYINIMSNYVYLDIGYSDSKSYIYLKYLPYKITGLLVWSYKIILDKNNYKFDGFNYLPVNLKYLYMNYVNFYNLNNLPILLEYLNMFGCGRKINIICNYLKKLEIFEQKKISDNTFKDICDIYCKKSDKFHYINNK